MTVYATFGWQTTVILFHGLFIAQLFELAQLAKAQDFSIPVRVKGAGASVQSPRDPP